MKKILYSILVMFLLSIVIGCMHSNSNKVLLDVGYIQEYNDLSCATTAIAMIISYYEKQPLDAETVWKISEANEYVLREYGNDIRCLKRISDHYGYKSEFLENRTIADIEKFLSQGIPVMVNIKVASQQTHALLIVGYDKNKKVFYIEDAGSINNKILKYSGLEQCWSAYLISSREYYHSVFIVYPKK
jgi:ABC-type bacteriocin/lantibiotic exporter with double-glycine peptidase domain